MAIRDLMQRGGRSRLPARGGGSWTEFDTLRDEIDRVFDSFFDGMAVPARRFEDRLTVFSPRLDMSETEKEIRISVELPGLSEKDIGVTLDDGMLVITGEKKDEREEKERNFYRSERTYGSFERSVPLPAQIDRDNVQATFKKGVLEIILQKTGPAKEGAKRIAVAAAE